MFAPQAMWCYMASVARLNSIRGRRQNDPKRDCYCSSGRLAVSRLCARQSHDAIAAASPQRPEIAGGMDIPIVRELAKASMTWV